VKVREVHDAINWPFLCKHAGVFNSGRHVFDKMFQTEEVWSVWKMMRKFPSRTLNDLIKKQESRAVAKLTARCADKSKQTLNSHTST